MKMVSRKGMIWKGLVFVTLAWVAFVLATLRPANAGLYPAAGGGVTVYVLNNGFHTDIALPADAVRARGGLLANSASMAGDHAWLIYGWGDQGFFIAHGFSFTRAVDGLRALFRPGNPSVIRLYGVDRTPDAVYGKTVAVPVVLSPQGFAAMERHIEASLRARGPQPVVTLNKGDGVYFFDSVEHFSIARVCNNWTSDQLSAAGLPTAPSVDGLAPLLSLDLRLRAHVRP